MPKVSIIVPVYKTEKYLDRCVMSLVNQTLSDLEIILVDDGSTDNCPKLCDEWCKKDNRIRVVHKENGGLSSARNAGIDIAQGKYIGFVDSDDDVEPDMYEKLCNIIKREDVDFVLSDYIRVESDNRNQISLNIEGGLYNKEKIVDKVFPSLIMGQDLNYGPLLSVCQCLYKTEFLKNNKLLFDEEIKWSEDNIFSAIVGYKTNSFYYYKGDGLYHYYSNPNSITTSYRENAWNVYCIMNRHLHEFFDNKKDYNFSYELKLHMIFYACNCLGQISSCKNSKKEKSLLRKNILYSNELREAFVDFSFPKIWSWKLKLQILFMKYKSNFFLSLI